MSIRRIFVFVLLVALLGGSLFLMTYDQPPPVQSIEIEIPDERLPQ